MYSAIAACTSNAVIGARLITANGPVIILNIYRPGSERPSSLFFEELTSLLEMLVVYSCLVVVSGNLTCRFTMRIVRTLAT